MNGEPPLGGSDTQTTFDSWRWQYQNRLKSLNDLRPYLPEREVQLLYEHRVKINLGITPYYLSLINWDDEDDPIRRQCIPTASEYTDRQCWQPDPLHEEEQCPLMDGQPVIGLVHRYPDRVLVITTDECSMYCRHCTRRRLWDDGIRHRTPHEFERILDYIRKDDGIHDVILSGGDPMTLSVTILDYMLTRLREIPHVEVIRIGTRFPVVLPQRFYDKDILDVLDRHAPIWLNTHFNCANEITPASREAIMNIRKTGATVCNQTVLLKGVNDTPEKMLALCRKLVSIGVKPYYLFFSDMSTPAHMRTSVETGMNILEEMRGQISGLAIPTYIVDTHLGKVPLLPNYVAEINGDNWILRNKRGIIRVENPQV